MLTCDRTDICIIHKNLFIIYLYDHLDCAAMVGSLLKKIALALHLAFSLPLTTYPGHFLRFISPRFGRRLLMRCNMQPLALVKRGGSFVQLGSAQWKFALVAYYTYEGQDLVEE